MHEGGNWQEGGDRRRDEREGGGTRNEGGELRVEGGG